MPETLSQAELSEIKAALAEGHSIRAISLYRRKTGANLKEAMLFVQKLTRGETPVEPLPTDLLDLAASILLRSHPSGPTRAEQERLKARWSEAQRISAFKQACHLADLAYNLCDRIRDGKLTQEKAMIRLKKECPGFSEDIYTMAYGSGMFAGR